MVPLIVQPVLVNAVVLATPTSPAVVDLVQVTAGPPRMPKLENASPDGTVEEGAGTSSTPNDAKTADSAVSRDTVDMVFSWRYVGRRGDPRIHLNIEPCSPRYAS